MILILTQSLDPHADYIARKLRERGADFVRFNPARFPTEAEITVAYSAMGQARRTLRARDEIIDLGSLAAVWHRRPQTPVAHAEIADAPGRDYVEVECKTFVHDVWNSLDCLSVPAPPPVIRRAELKASQLKVAGELGLELPPTLITNSPEDFREFYRQHNGNIVSKPASPAFFSSVGNTFCRYTNIVSKRDVGYAEAVRLCPVIFQSYVQKKVELRITVVGREAFAAEIRSQETNHTRHDWRRYDLDKTPHSPHELPRDVERRCVRLVERLGLCYGAIDMVLTPDGRYVFLEVNPNGQYLWIEFATGLPISDAICDLLMSELPPQRRTNHALELHAGGSR